MAKNNIMYVRDANKKVISFQLSVFSLISPGLIPRCLRRGVVHNFITEN